MTHRPPHSPASSEALAADPAATVEIGRRRALLALAGAGIFAQMPGPLRAQEPTAWEKIRGRGTLSVGLYKNNAPYSFTDAQKPDEPRGVDADLGRALALHMGLRFAPMLFDAGENMQDDLRNMVWKGHYLGFGPADVLMHVPVDKFLMQEAPQTLIYAPYARETVVLMYRYGRPGLPSKEEGGVTAVARNPSLLREQWIAVERGSGAASAVLGYQNGLLRERVKIYDDPIQAATAVITGEVGCAHVGRAQAEYAIHSAGLPQADFALGSLTLPSLPTQGWPIGLAVKKDNRELAVALEQALAALRQNGTLLDIFQRYGMVLQAP